MRNEQQLGAALQGISCLGIFQHIPNIIYFLHVQYAGYLSFLSLREWGIGSKMIRM